MRTGAPGVFGQPRRPSHAMFTRSKSPLVSLDLHVISNLFAQVLISYLSTLELTNQSFLELGSGCGAVGMYVAKRGATVVLSDLPRALPLLRRNLLANGLNCSACALPWGARELPQEVAERLPFDVVLASDCSYDFTSPDVPSPSIDALLATARRCGTRAFIAVSRRKNEVEASSYTFQTAVSCCF